MSCNSTNSPANPATSFPNAPLMGTLATNYPVIWEEICMIQQAILAASSQCQPGGGQMCTVVGGNTPMTFTAGVLDVTVVDGGLGYFTDTPSVYFIPPVGVVPGAIATGSVITNGGNILEIDITNGGLGYQPVPATMSVSSLLGVGASLQPLVNGAGNIVNINIVNGGSGYTINDTVVATRAVLPNIAYVDAVFKITSVSVTGEIIEVVILNPGLGYQPSTAEIQIVSTLKPAFPYPLGTGVMGNVLTDINGTITQVIISNPGAGYASFPPYMVISNPGTGAQTTVTLTATSVSAVNVTASGSNYVVPATGVIFNPPTAALPNPPVTQAQVEINVAVNTFGTIPNLYWQVWAGTTTNRPIQLQLNQVLAYFKALGYTIQIQSNPQTGSTIVWRICW